MVSLRTSGEDTDENIVAVGMGRGGRAGSPGALAGEAHFTSAGGAEPCRDSHGGGPGAWYPVPGAMREAALSWTTAVQSAEDELGEARAALRTWDAAAPFDERQTRWQLLRSDEGGYVRQALAAIRRAARLARTPAERWRADEKRRRWESALLSAAPGPGLETPVCTRRNPPSWVENAPSRAGGFCLVQAGVSNPGAPGG